MQNHQILYCARSASDAVLSVLKEYLDFKPAHAFSEQDRERASRLLTNAIDFLSKIIDNIPD